MKVFLEESRYILPENKNSSIFDEIHLNVTVFTSSLLLELLDKSPSLVRIPFGLFLRIGEI